MNVFTRSFKNYFKGLKYVFTPLGVLFLGIIIALSISVGGAINSINELFTQIGSTLGDNQIDWTEIGGRIYTFFFQYDWHKPTAVSDLVNPDYLIPLVGEFVHEVFPEVQVSSKEIFDLITTCVHDLIRYLFIFIIIIALSFVVSSFITDLFIKRDLTKRKFRYLFLFALVDTLVVVISVILCLLSIKLGWWGIPLIILILTAHLIFTFFEGWLLHAKKYKIKLRKIINPKNIGLLFLSNGIIFTINVIVLVVLSFVAPIYISVAVGLVLIQVTYSVIGSNAEAYVEDYSQKELQTKKS